MATNANKSQKFDLSDYELNDTDKSVFKLQLEYPELTQKELSKLVNLTESQLSRIVNKPAYKKAKEEFDKSWIEILLKGKHKASRKMLELIDSDIPRIALDASKAVLQLDDIKPEMGKDVPVVKIEFV